MTTVVKFYVLYYVQKIYQKSKNEEKRMSSFDEYVERREEERNRERYARLNALIEQSLRTRSHEEVVLELLGGLNIPLTTGSLPLGAGDYAKTGNYAKTGGVAKAFVF